MSHVGVYGQCRDFPDLSVPRRVLLENTTISDLNYGGSNRTSPAAFAVSSQPVVVNSSGSINARSA